MALAFSLSSRVAPSSGATSVTEPDGARRPLEGSETWPGESHRAELEGVGEGSCFDVALVSEPGFAVQGPAGSESRATSIAAPSSSARTSLRLKVPRVRRRRELGPFSTVSRCLLSGGNGGFWSTDSLAFERRYTLERQRR